MRFLLLLSGICDVSFLTPKSHHPYCSLISLFPSLRPPNHYNELVGFGLGNVESVIEYGVSLAGEGQEPMVLGRYVEATLRDET